MTTNQSYSCSSKAQALGGALAPQEDELAEAASLCAVGTHSLSFAVAVVHLQGLPKVEFGVSNLPPESFISLSDSLTGTFDSAQSADIFALD